MVSRKFQCFLIQCYIYYHVSKDDGIIVKLEHIVDVPSDEDDDTLKGILTNGLIKKNVFLYKVSMHQALILMKSPVSGLIYKMTTLMRMMKAFLCFKKQILVPNLDPNL